MNPINQNNEHVQNLQLTNEEIQSIPAFAQADDATLEKLRSAVYELSILLYQIHHHESA
ncbi:MAG: hypothetical protein ACK4RX_12800 [Chitinophagaceae bacterium]